MNILVRYLLLVLLAVRALGVETVYLSEISETRRAKARDLGATAVFDPRELKIPQKMRELTEGQGVDVSVEAVGIEASLKDCLASTRQRGTVVVQGIFTDRVPIHMLGFVSREITMIGTNSIDPELALEWIAAGRVEPERDLARGQPLRPTDLGLGGGQARDGRDDAPPAGRESLDLGPTLTHRWWPPRSGTTWVPSTRTIVVVAWPISSST